MHLMFLLSSTGCGKTTLISALSNRMSLGSTLTGDTYINGYHNEVSTDFVSLVVGSDVKMELGQVLMLHVFIGLF